MENIVGIAYITNAVDVINMHPFLFLLIVLIIKRLSVGSRHILRVVGAVNSKKRERNHEY